MQIKSITPTSVKRTFTLNQASEILPLVFHITENSHKTVKDLVNKLQSIKTSNLTIASEIEDKISSETAKWEHKMKRLGLVPKGMWLVDFDNGSGYYCWKFPENEIRFWHQYQDGFSGRVEIQ
jgi:hypothetical protein